MSTQDTYFKMLHSRTYMTIRSISVSNKQEDLKCVYPLYVLEWKLLRDIEISLHTLKIILYPYSGWST